MTPGITTALMRSDAPLAALEVDEMHMPTVSRFVDPQAMVLLNLSRDQLDRVGEIGAVERRLRKAVNEHPNAVVIANCDDRLGIVPMFTGLPPGMRGWAIRRPSHAADASSTPMILGESYL